MTEIDPPRYAIAAQFVAAHATQLRALYVSVTPYGIEIQGDPNLPLAEQLNGLRRIARYLGTSITVSGPFTPTVWAKNLPFRSHEFGTEYDGVPVRGFVHERVEVGRTDEVPNRARVTVLPGGAA